MQLMLLANQRFRAAGCNFSGALPDTWRSESLQLLDLSGNQLTGVLPSAWGEKTALPSLGQLYLQENAIRGEACQRGPPLARACGGRAGMAPGLCPPGCPTSGARPLAPLAMPAAPGDNGLAWSAAAGPIPDPQWTSVGFSAPCTLHLRPGCKDACGAQPAPACLSPPLRDRPCVLGACAMSCPGFQGSRAHTT